MKMLKDSDIYVSPFSKNVLFLIMVQLTTQQRVFVVKTWISTRSFIEVKRLFQNNFPEREPPTRKTIWINVKKYENHGTSLNRNIGNSGRRRTARSDENITRVQDILADPPIGFSSRRNGLGLSQSTFTRIVKKDLKWHPYKMRIRHELKPTDYNRRVVFCEWLLRKCHDRRFLANIIIGDEAGFAMNGEVNSQNVRRYAPRGEPPNFNYDRKDSRSKHNVWIGLCGNGVLFGPYFFEGTITGMNYLQMLNEELFPQLLNTFGGQFHNGHFSRLWWFQDGAPAHRLNQVQEWLSEFFPNHIVALNRETEWPPRSPDLTPCDYFLWGYLKSKVYVTPPENMDDLRQKIITEVQLLKDNNDLVQRAMRDMTRRANKCIEVQGHHIERLLENN